VGDSVTSDNLQRKEKTKSCRREGKKWMKVKKRKEKSSCERQAAKKPMHQQNPLPQENTT